MSAVAVSSSLNPDAPLFIPAALLQVEDFSPQWWDLITTTAWFRDHWSREHAHLDEMAEQLDAATSCPTRRTSSTTNSPSRPPPSSTQRPPPPPSRQAGDAPRGFREKLRHSEKPTKYAGSPKSSAPT
ncbi:unnamed protein product [Miscanthus lutarioriparius]|uniref:Early response to dehydration 15-like protein n=1 Tax=Miscanthus lutarioriparius TaxID=422564 RepID=A0A811MAF6_9POAL|nr:unnamed protein product [Miscanthus lutarioriparius]